MKSQRGFTLIELMIASAVATILAAIAYPNLQGPLLKARRIDGLAALMQLQTAQERWHANANTYASLTDLKMADSTSEARYRIDVSNPSSDGFVAMAIAQGAQAADRQCKVLKLVVTDGNARYASGSDLQADNSDALNKRCWNL